MHVRVFEMGVIMAEERCTFSSLLDKFGSGGSNEKSPGTSIGLGEIFIYLFIFSFFSLGGLEANSSGIPLDLVPPRFDIGSQCFQVAKHQCYCCLPLSSLFFQVTSRRIACHKVRQMEICIKTQGELDIHG